MAKEPRKGKDHPDAKAMQEQREQRAQATAEALKRSESSQPTPTQEENDLARLGITVDDKQDDGSGPTVITKVIVANQPLPAGGYEPQPAPKEGREPRTARPARETS